ncbi:MAG: Branched-chain amino acid transport system permease protein LivM, partial [uncultured Acetobacteraceae bacterium]
EHHSRRPRHARAAAARGGCADAPSAVLARCRGSRCRPVRRAAADRERVRVLRGLLHPAIRRAVLGLEHPRRLRGLRELRRGRLHGDRGLHRHRAAEGDRAGPPAGHRRGRRGRRAARPRHGLPHLAAARGVLLHRHALPRRGAAHAGGELGLRRRLARRLHRPPAGGAALRQLRRVPVRRHAGAGHPHGRHRPRGPAFPHRARIAGAPRQRARGRGGGCADTAPQAGGGDAVRRADGRGRRALALLQRLSEPGGRLRPGLRGQRHRHAADRRRGHLGRPGDRRGGAGRAPASRDRHHLLGAESLDRRLDAGDLRRARPARHPRLVPGAAV